jgi:hypothetical protein
MAPRPAPTIIEMGVANPNAHGQAMINTATEFTMANVSLGSGPHKAQTTNARAAMTTTVGTKYPETLSASF